MDNNVRYAIEILDRWSGPLKSFDRNIEKISRKRIDAPIKDMNRSISQLKSNLDRYKKAYDNSFRLDHQKKYNQLIEETERRIKKIQNATSSCTEKTSKWGDAINKIGGVLAAYQAAQAVVSFGKDSIMAAAQVEKYTTSLKTMLGSKGAARERMTEYADFAKSTPFELTQVVEAGNQLQAIGRYSRENLSMLGDLASGSGKPMEQVMNAYAKLATGQKGESAMMFRDLLISNQDWANAVGKNFEAITTDEMMSVLPKIMQAKGFMGMMEQQAKTTEGRISNLSDAMFQLKVSVGDKLKPSFDSFLMGATSTVDILREWIEVPITQKIADEKYQLNSLVGTITDSNISQEQRMNLLNQLQQEYPEFLGNLDKETVKNGELLKTLDGVNEAYDRKIKIAGIKDNETKEKEKQKELSTKLEKKIAFKEARQRELELSGYFKQMGITEGLSLTPSGSFEYRTFEQNLDIENEKRQKNIAANPNDKAAEDFMSKVYEYKASKKIRIESVGSVFDLVSDIYNKDFDSYGLTDNVIKNLSTKLKIQNKVVDFYTKKANAEINKDVYQRASHVNTDDKSTYEKMFGATKSKGANDVKKEFEGLLKKDKGQLTSQDYTRMSDIMEGKAKYMTTGSSGSGSSAAALESAQESIIGGGKNVKNITITIGKMVESINVSSETMEQGADNFAEKVKQVFLNAVNDANYAV